MAALYEQVAARCALRNPSDDAIAPSLFCLAAKKHGSLAHLSLQSLLLRHFGDFRCAPITKVSTESHNHPVNLVSDISSLSARRKVRMQWVQHLQWQKGTQIISLFFSLTKSWEMRRKSKIHLIWTHATSLLLLHPEGELLSELTTLYPFPDLAWGQLCAQDSASSQCGILA